MEPTPRLSQFGDVNPPELQPIVDRALAKQRDERYQGCSELGRDLECIRSSIELPARFAWHQSGERLTRRLGARKTYFIWKYAIPALLLAAVIPLAWFVHSRASRQTPSSPQSPQTSPSSSMMMPAQPSNATRGSSDPAGSRVATESTTAPSSRPVPAAIQPPATATRPSPAGSRPSQMKDNPQQDSAHRSGSSASPVMAVPALAMGPVASGSSDARGKIVSSNTR